MKKILQNLKNGKTILEDLPIPSITEDEILIKTEKSLISVGTESMLLNFANSNLINKAINHKDRVKDVLKKIKNEGVIKTYNAVNYKLSEPIELGYSNCGKVIKIGNNVRGFKVGDRVVSNKSHSEYVVSSENFTVKVPSEVIAEHACFAILGSVALNAIRIAKPEIGENCAVIGMGLVGILTSQLLKANGCNVMGVDINDEKLKFTENLGITSLKNNNDLKNKIDFLTKNLGCDHVFIATNFKNSSSLDVASKISRNRGKIILIGDADITFNRNILYKKELSFYVSRSYGPGRYDYEFENKNYKFPYEYIRWTLTSNISTFLELIKKNKISLSPLITHKFKFEDSLSAFKLIQNNKINKIGIILNYIEKDYKKDNHIILNNNYKKNKAIDKNTNISFIGCGNYCSKVLLPIFSKHNLVFNTVCSKNGISAKKNSQIYNFKYYSTDAIKVINENSSNTVVITTRHDTHASFVLAALNNNKNIFLEKPLAIKLEEIKKIRKKITDLNNNTNNLPIIMVGFNRRYSSYSQKIKELLSLTTGNKFINYNINAGKVPDKSWIADEEISGGRIIGEVCHFVDLIKYFIEKKITDYKIIKGNKDDDGYSINFLFEDNSICNINYFTNGPYDKPKENIEIIVDNKSLELTDFKILKGVGWSNFKKMTNINQDKGQKNCINAFINAVKTGKSDKLININDLLETSEMMINLKNDY